MSSAEADREAPRTWNDSGRFTAGVLIALVAVGLIIAALGGLYSLSMRNRTASRASGADTASLVVTRGFGSRVILNKRPALGTSKTVLDLLSANAKVDTAYGGGFVNSIGGLTSRYSGTGAVREDWFYYVDGLQGTVGAAQLPVAGGDSVWWDFHRWDFAAATPAVVGQYPEPFAHGGGATRPGESAGGSGSRTGAGADGQALPTRIAYGSGSRAAAGALASSLRRSGAPSVGVARLARGLAPPRGTELILVGPWNDLVRLGWLRDAVQHPRSSGLFARFDAGGAVVFDVLGRTVRRPGPGGAVMATARADEPQSAIWLVTGSEPADVARAVAVLAHKPGALAGRFGVLVDRAGGVTPLPLAAGS